MANRLIKHIVAKLVGASTEETFDIYDESALHSTDIVDNLLSTDATKVLSASQGKALNDSLENALSLINTFPSGVAPSEWTGNYTNTFSYDFSNAKAILITAEYNGQIMDSIFGPKALFNNKAIYLGWNDGSLKASAKITIASNFLSGTVSNFTGFTVIKLYAVI